MNEKKDISGRKIIHTRRLAHYLLNNGNLLIKIMDDSKNHNIVLYVFDIDTKEKNIKIKKDTEDYNQIVKDGMDKFDFSMIEFNDDLLFLEKCLLKKRIIYFSDISKLKKQGGLL